MIIIDLSRIRFVRMGKSWFLDRSCRCDGYHKISRSKTVQIIAHETMTSRKYNTRVHAYYTYLGGLNFRTYAS